MSKIFDALKTSLAKKEAESRSAAEEYADLIWKLETNPNVKLDQARFVRLFEILEKSEDQVKADVSIVREAIRLRSLADSLPKLLSAYDAANSKHEAALAQRQKSHLECSENVTNTGRELDAAMDARHKGCQASRQLNELRAANPQLIKATA